MGSKKAKPPDIGKRIADLSAREAQLAMKAKERKRCALDLKLEEYESALELAETYDEPLAVVLRACFRFGMEHHQQWASKASGVSPFHEGSWQPRRPSQLDPTGTARRTPPVQEEIFVPVEDTRAPRTVASARPPAATERIVDTIDPVFSDREIPVSVLPQGYTDDSRVSKDVEPDEPLTPMPETPGDDVIVGPASAPFPDVEQAVKIRVRENDRKRAEQSRPARRRRTRQSAVPTEDENIFAPQPEEAPSSPVIVNTTLEALQEDQPVHVEEDVDPNDLL